VGFLPPDLLAEALRDQTGGLAGGMIGFLEWPRWPWGLGVELHGDKSPHWVPDMADPASFGHAGASGCLAWVDPTIGGAWAMLGARTGEGWLPDFPIVSAAIQAALRGSLCHRVVA